MVMLKQKLNWNTKKQNKTKQKIKMAESAK